ncbi:MAG: TIM44-like domain-containing protein [Candidatus Rifleibacteriota bacterium]
MDDIFKIGKKTFIGLIVSIVLGAIALKIKAPDMSGAFEVLELLFSDGLVVRTGYYAFFIISAIFIFLMPFSLFLVYWCSLVLACYILLANPLLAILYFILIGIPALLYRFKYFELPGYKITLPVALVLTLILFIFAQIINKPAFSSFVYMLILLYPAIHVLSMRPGDIAQSRFASEEKQDITGLSSTQKARMSNILEAGWWELVRPHVESTATNICAFSDNFSTIKLTGIQTRQEPHKHTITQNHTRNLNLANLKKRDKLFDEIEFLNRARKAFKMVQTAVYKQNIEKIQPFVSDALYEQFNCRIQELKAAGIKYKLSELKCKSATVDHVFSDGSFDEIQVLIQATVAESVIDIKTGSVIGKPGTRNFYEYWSFVRRPSVKTLKKPGLLEGSCPNCGAPIKVGQATVCEVCKSFIRSGYYDWVLSKITQGCEWSYADPSLVPSWQQLKQADPQFTIHQVEDLAAVIFWKLRQAEREKKVEEVYRFIREQIAEKLKNNFKKSVNGLTEYYENIAIATVDLKGISIKEEEIVLYVLVVWSGVPVKLNPQGRVVERIRYNKPVRDVFVLARDAKCQTNQNNILSSAHCSSCGGPLKSTFAVHCGYCGSNLKDGKDWQLKSLLKEDSKEYQDILTRKSEMVSKRLQKHFDKEAGKRQKERIELETRSGRDIITVMVSILLADGVMQDSEMKFVKEMAQKYHMPDETLEGLIESVKEDSTYVPMPDNNKEKLDIIKGAVQMAYADDDFSEKEEEALEYVAGQLGYSKFDLKRVIKSEQKLRHKEGKKI